MHKHHDQGLDNRTRDANGEIRHKRSDTKVESLRKEYGEQFAAGYPGEAELKQVLEESGEESLSQYLKNRFHH